MRSPGTAAEPGRSGREGAGERTVLLAAVVSPDGVRFTAAAVDRASLYQRLSAYVDAHASRQLWAEDAVVARLERERGDHEAAVTHYFASVGRRWDVEWLVFSEVSVPTAAD